MRCLQEHRLHLSAKRYGSESCGYTEHRWMVFQCQLSRIIRRGAVRGADAGRGGGGGDACACARVGGCAILAGGLRARVGRERVAGLSAKAHAVENTRTNVICFDYISDYTQVTSTYHD